MPDSDPNSLHLEDLPLRKVASTNVLLDDLKMTDKAAVGDCNPFPTLWIKLTRLTKYTYDNVEWMCVSLEITQTLATDDGFSELGTVPTAMQCSAGGIVGQLHRRGRTSP